LSAQGSTTAARVRRRAAARVRRRQRSVRVVVAGIGVATLAAVVLGLVFAGSPDTLAAGTRVAGIDVGGMSQAQARAMLARRAAALAKTPVTFVAGDRRWQITPYALGVGANWTAAVRSAAADGGGSTIARGWRRLALRVSSSDTVPGTHAYAAAVSYELDRLASAIDRPDQEPRLVRHGLRVTLVPGTPGRQLVRAQAAGVIVQALAGFDRHVVRLPVRVTSPAVTERQLVPAMHAARRAVARPLTLAFKERRWHLSRWQVAAMLRLPTGGATTLAIGGPAADAYFRRLDRKVSRPPRDADWDVSSSGVRVVPAEPGFGLDVPRTAAALLTAARRPKDRVVNAVVGVTPPKRTTASALAMGITGVVGSYETIYGGIANRIHNVQLVAHLVDHKLIAPGTTFSFNRATGARTAARGFLDAPVIINGELQTGLGGGVCQVSTTVFNAAYEAGLPITARTNHALYISHYPLGRDATVDYPDVDLKFVNDTGHWLLLRTFVGSSSLVVALYGTPQHRRVVTDTAPLRVIAPQALVRQPDPQLEPGTTAIADPGMPAQSTSVRRRVYSAHGKLLSDQTWYSSYVSQPKIVLVGPKKPKPKRKPKPTPNLPQPASSPFMLRPLP